MKTLSLIVPVLMGTLILVFWTMPGHVRRAYRSACNLFLDADKALEKMD